MSPVREQIAAALRAALDPQRLTVVDDSAAHHGHAGSRPEGETHFTVEIVAARFEGLSRVQRERLVTGALHALLAGRVHALSVRALTPAERARRQGGADGASG